MKINTNKILFYLAEKQMTRTVLSEKSGISRQNLSTILTRGSCAEITAGKLAKGLNLNLIEIIEEG